MLRPSQISALVAATFVLAAPAPAHADRAQHREVPIAHIAQFVPDDPGRGSTPGGWLKTQWNFTGPWGVNAPAAWQHLIDAGHPGGSGVVVAVLDTGVAYQRYDRYRMSPDLGETRFVPGWDFVSGDSHPNDSNGHGTHVASTIAESTDNGIGLTGLAYGVSLMPIRVLNSAGEGDAVRIAKGVRWAVDHGANVINMSLEFDIGVRAAEVPELLSALRYARSKRVVVVGASGNEGYPSVAYPARASSVFAVGATTEHGCLSEYSNVGAGLDIVAPGGGSDAALLSEPNCRPDGPAGRDIYQVTIEGRPGNRHFGIPSDYEGTSMAAPHVAALAALVIASGVVGANPTAQAVERRIEATARDLGPSGYDRRYGYGLIDADAATRPGPAVRPATPSTTGATGPTGSTGASSAG